MLLWCQLLWCIWKLQIHWAMKSVLPKATARARLPRCCLNTFIQFPSPASFEDCKSLDDSSSLCNLSKWSTGFSSQRISFDNLAFAILYISKLCTQCINLTKESSRGGMWFCDLFFGLLPNFSNNSRTKRQRHLCSGSRGHWRYFFKVADPFFPRALMHF